MYTETCILKNQRGNRWWVVESLKKVDSFLQKSVTKKMLDLVYLYENQDSYVLQFLMYTSH